VGDELTELLVVECKEFTDTNSTAQLGGGLRLDTTVGDDSNSWIDLTVLLYTRVGDDGNTTRQQLVLILLVGDLTWPQ